MPVVEEFILEVNGAPGNRTLRESALAGLQRIRNGDSASLQSLGEMLFRLAFPEDTSLSEKFIVKLGTCSAAKNTLRTRIRTADAELRSFPWELLRIPQDYISRFERQGIPLPPVLDLGSLRRHWIVRDYSTGLQPNLSPIGKLKILVAWANPGGAWGLVPSVGAEALTAADALQADGRPVAEVREVAGATKSALLAELRAFKPEVFHFTGHGCSQIAWRPSGAPGNPSLVLGKEGLPEYLVAEELLPELEAASMRIVVLNCCYGTAAAPFVSSFAHRLMRSANRRSLSVVVAHQTEIDIFTACSFARTFYEELVKGESVEGAVEGFRRVSGAATWLPAIFAGDADTQIFRATENDPYPIDFGPYLSHYDFFVQQTRFTGRAFLRRAIEEFISRLQTRNEGGVFLLTAPPGMGKTAFLWNCVHRGSPGMPHFFYRGGAAELRDPDDALHSLYREIQKQFREIEPDPDITPLSFATLLRNAGQECLKRSTVLRIVVDALDEAQGRTWQAADIIPTLVPPGVCWIVSSRPGEMAEELSAGHGVEQFELQAGSKENLDDVTAACAQVLQGVYFEEACGSGDRVEALARKLAEKAEGNFLVLRYFFEDQIAAAATLKELESASVSLSGSIVTVYEQFFACLRRDTSQAWADPMRPVYTILKAIATSLGPVTEDMVAAAFDLDPADWDLAFPRMRQYLTHGMTRGESRGESTYAIYHTTFREFVIQRFDRGLSAARQRWAAYAESWRDMLDSTPYGIYRNT